MLENKDKLLAIREAVRFGYDSKRLRDAAQVLTMVVSPRMTEEMFHCMVQSMNLLKSIEGEVDAQIRENETLESFRGF